MRKKRANQSSSRFFLASDSSYKEGQDPFRGIIRLCSWVTIGHRQKGGVSKNQGGEILGLDASSILDDLLSQGLIYCDPSRKLSLWC